MSTRRLRPLSGRQPVVTCSALDGTPQQRVWTSPLFAPPSPPPPPPPGTPPLELRERGSAACAAGPPTTVASLEEYEVVAEIGRGSFGCTVAARRQSEALIAVKIIDKERLPAALEPCDVRYPFVARSLWVKETPRRVYSATDLYAASLEEVTSATLSSALFYAGEIALGLAYLHSKGIIHRSLKPSNVLIDRRGHVALSDHGLPDLSVSMVPFAAPERLRGDPDGAPGDWWSFGAVSFWLLAGVSPFDADTSRALFVNILRGQPAFDRSPAFCDPASDPARTALECLFIKDPDERVAHIDTVKQLPWFDELPWNDLLQKFVVPPNSSPQFVLFYDDARDSSRSDRPLSPLATLEGHDVSLPPRPSLVDDDETATSCLDDVTMVIPPTNDDPHTPPSARRDEHLLAHNMTEVTSV